MLKKCLRFWQNFELNIGNFFLPNFWLREVLNTFRKGEILRNFEWKQNQNMPPPFKETRVLTTSHSAWLNYTSWQNFVYIFWKVDGVLFNPNGNQFLLDVPGKWSCSGYLWNHKAFLLEVCLIFRVCVVYEAQTWRQAANVWFWMRV